VIEGIQGALLDDPEVRFHLTPDGRRLTFEPSGISLAQADDGTLVTAPNLEQLEAALPEQKRYAALGLAREGAGGFGTSEAFVAELVPANPALPNSIRRVFGEVNLGSSTELRVTLEFQQSSDPEQLLKQASSVLGSLRELAAALRGTDFAGERALLARAASRVAEPNQVIFTTIWERSEIDRGAENLGEWLRRYVTALSANSP
jgi:hypothetical protein